MKNTAMIVGGLFFLITFSSPALIGQEREMRVSPEQKEKIESMHIGFITDKLALSPKQASEFWPVYNEYREEKRSLMGERTRDRKDPLEMSEAEARDALETMMAEKEQKIELEKKLHMDLADILSPNQVLALSQAKSQFRRHMLRQVRSRVRGGESGDGRMQERRQRLREGEHREQRRDRGGQ